MEEYLSKEENKVKIKMKKTISISCVLILIATNLFSQQSNFPKLTGPYLGQKPPGITPEIFAPGIISTEHQEHSSLAISPDGKEMWWSRWRRPNVNNELPQEIVFIKFENGKWTEPKVASFSGKYSDGSPAFSSDGNKIYFYSKRPLNDESTELHDNDIWYTERISDGWSKPVNLGSMVNSSFVDAVPSLAANGNVYFMSDRNQYYDPTGNNDLFVSKYADGKYSQSESMSEMINTSWAREAFQFIARDESYIVFNRDSRKFDSDGNTISGDRILMISFKNEDGKWQNPIDMGLDFYNTRFPSVSHEGKYLFFTKYSEGTSEDFYWVDAKIIDELRPKK